MILLFLRTEKLLKGLNLSKALGPDELHSRDLKELVTELGPVFANHFQQSIDTGEIPKEWALANICPLFKKSDRSLACNYRPVSLICVQLINLGNNHSLQKNQMHAWWLTQTRLTTFQTSLIARHWVGSHT